MMLCLLRGGGQQVLVSNWSVVISGHDREDTIDPNFRNHFKWGRMVKLFLFNIQK